MSASATSACRPPQNFAADMRVSEPAKIPEVEITAFTKFGGPLSKHLKLKSDGSLQSDGSACIMSQGNARRERFDNLTMFAQHIGSLKTNQAIALGTLIKDLPDEVKIITKAKLNDLNGAAKPDMIARTGSHISYRAGKHAFALLDHDSKGMPAEVAAHLQSLGGFWNALVSVFPCLDSIARVTRASTSAGLYRTDTGTRLPGSNGLHVYLLVVDGTDINRFLQTLHSRCWLAGLGWMTLGAGGQMLERSIVDRVVGAPERLVFEGAPILETPLAQSEESRRPIAANGHALDTITAFPSLTIAEQSRLAELHAKEIARLEPDSIKMRESYISEQAKRLCSKAGTSEKHASKVVAKQCSGILLPDVALLFDDAEFAHMTVGDVLTDPTRFDGATLADPLEGIDYGRCKAKLLRRSDGTPFIHSFAHGRTIYELKYDARSVRSAIEQAEKDDMVDTFVKLAVAADMEAEEIEELRNLVSQRTGIGKRVIDNRLKHSLKQRAQERENEDRNRSLIDRLDRRLRVPVPSPDAPWIPQMELLNEVLGKAKDIEPPMRDVDGFVIQVRTRNVPSMHALTSDSVNNVESTETRLPPPELPLITRLDEGQVAELIERHIDYVDEDGRSVHLPSAFVKHFVCRHDGALPIANAVATLPIIMPDGKILSGRGLDRQRGVVFRVPNELQALLPDTVSCTSTAVATAMQFLMDDWLHDVAADYSGKCVLIALALTVMERLILPERPAYFITAGQRGGGKTTVSHMISIAVVGRRAGAAGWSDSKEERRKSLLAYLGEGVPLIFWDNIERGSTISCQSIEKALTAETYTDRILGISETRTVPATTVQIFTGNNIAPRGDMVS